MIQKLGGTRGDGRARPGLGRARRWPRSPTAPRVPVSARRPDRRHQVRRLGRHQRAHRQPRDRPRLRPAGRRRRRGDVRGAGRAVRLRAAHGGPRRHAGASARRSWPRWPRAARYYGTMDHGSFGGGNITGGLQHGRGEVDRRLHQERHRADRRPAQARHPAAPPRPLPHGHGPRRRRSAGAIPTSTTPPRWSR